jgi:molybdopterin molybdotransferase
MITPRTALSRILANVIVLGSESVPIAEAVGRVLAKNLRACADLPGFDNSAMDGYAVRAADCAPGASRPLKVLATARAGAVSSARVGRGEAVKIMTGAPLPRGADAVVMKEFTAPGPDGTVRILRTPRRGDHIRPRGEDVRRGARLLKKGVRLRPYEIALLAAQGIARVQVIRAPRVAILATGDELVSGSGRLGAGKIRNSNGPASAAALTRWGARVVISRVVRDDPASLRRAVRAALSRADLVLVTGGVSVGDFDYTQAVLKSIGARIVFWKVGMKPGKPLLLGLHSGKPIFGLPGNPVAVMVCIEEFVRPALETLQGHAPGHASYHLAGTADNAYPKPGDRQQYLFCRARTSGDGYRLTIIRPQGSAMLAMACSANALAVAPIGVRRVMPGDRLAFRWLK